MGIVAHRLELAVNHALKSVNATNYFNIFLSTLHSLFSQLSPKNVMELQEAASETRNQLIVITGHWYIHNSLGCQQFSSCESCLEKYYSALFLMIQISAATDCKRSSADIAKYRGIAENCHHFPFLI